jgi:hypothetical protein
VSSQYDIGKIVAVDIYRIAAARGKNKTGAVALEKFFIMVIRR